MCYLCEGVTLLGGALGLAGGVAQGEDDRPLVERSHVLDDLLCERASNGRHSYTEAVTSRLDESSSTVE